MADASCMALLSSRIEKGTTLVPKCSRTRVVAVSSIFSISSVRSIFLS